MSDEELDKWLRIIMKTLDAQTVSIQRLSERIKDLEAREKSPAYLK